MFRKLNIAAVMSTTILMAVATAEATIITKNLTTVVSDTYEGDPVDVNPVADVGTWVSTTFGDATTIGDVNDDASPGPAPGGGTQYVMISSIAGVGRTIGGEIPAIVNGDTVRFRSMVFPPSATQSVDYPWQFRLGSYDLTADGYTNTIINFYRYADGTFEATYESGGFTPFAEPSTLAFGEWQEWTIEKVFGTSTATLTIDGASVSFPSSSLVALPAGSEPYRMGFFMNSNTIHLDDVIPEPSSLSALALAGLTLMLRRCGRGA